MIYYYQIVNKPIAQKMLIGESCPVCNQQNTLQLTLYMKYISAIVPIFGMGRTTGVHCTVCNHIVKSQGASVFAKKNYSQNIKNEIKNLRASYKRTIWQLLYPWTGTLLFAGLVVTGLIMTRVKQFQDSKVAEILANPQAGDTYKSDWYVNNTRDKGALIKIIRISGDTIVIVRSSQLLDGADVFGKSHWNKISDDGFSPEEFKIKLSRFLKDRQFEEFRTSAEHPLGNVMGYGNSNYEFDVVERK